MDQFDRIDFAIVAILQNDARLPNKELAARVGLAPSSCHERVKRLWSEGLLRGAHATVDARKLGVGLEALLFIELAKHERGIVDSFLADVVTIPEVRSAFLITGHYDLVVHVVARDTTHLKDVALDKFTNRPGVTRIETSIIYEARFRAEVPLLLPREPTARAASKAAGPARRARSGRPPARPPARPRRGVPG